MATYQTGVSADGFETIRLGNACMSLCLLPQLGGKIHQLLDLRSGRDWLWKNPHIALRHPKPKLDYDQELDSGGWDEILFSVKPCQIGLPNDRYLSIGDHGNAVDRAWQVAEAGVNEAGDAICELTTSGHSPDFELRRRIHLHATQAEVDIAYRLVNTGHEPWPWLWCAHPLLAVESGMRIGIHAGQAMRSLNEEFSIDHVDHVWPLMTTASGQQLNLAEIFSNFTPADKFHKKIFVRSKGKVALSTGDETESLEFSYDAETLPWLGLWINRHSWSGCGSEPYLNLGVEPATVPHDLLSNAIEAGDAAWLDAGQSHEWSLKLTSKVFEPR